MSGRPAKLPFLPLYVAAWLSDPKLGFCTPATRGIWIDLICGMWADGQQGKITGTPKSLARVARCSEEELMAAVYELQETGTADVTPRLGPASVPPVVTVINRRMSRENEAKAEERKGARNRKAAERARKRHGDVTTKVTPEVTGGSRDVTGDITYSRDQRSDPDLNTPLNSDPDCTTPRARGDGGEVSGAFEAQVALARAWPHARLAGYPGVADFLDVGAEVARGAQSLGVDVGALAADLLGHFAALVEAHRRRGFKGDAGPKKLAQRLSSVWALYRGDFTAEDLAARPDATVRPGDRGQAPIAAVDYSKQEGT